MVRPWLIALVFLSLAFAACANDGRDLAAPQDWQTTTTRPLPPTSAPPQELGSTGLSLFSTDFEAGGEAPVVARCDGSNRFPSLAWTDVDPSLGASELAIALSDQTNPEEPLLLWLMGGIDPTVTSVMSGTFPNDGAFESLNDYGQPGWGSPCIESFETGRRDLQFRLYVLGQPSDLASGAPGNEAWDEVAAKAVETATILMRVGSEP